MHATVNLILLTLCHIHQSLDQHPMPPFPSRFHRRHFPINLLRQLVTAFNASKVWRESFLADASTCGCLLCIKCLPLALWFIVSIQFTSHYTVYHSNRLLSGEYSCAKILIARVSARIRTPQCLSLVYIHLNVRYAHEGSGQKNTCTRRAQLWGAVRERVDGLYFRR